MFILGPVGFLLPWLLAGLIALPILWILLRAVPPAPIRRRFPGVALLLGLKDDETQTDKTPWWLLMLRILAVAAFIIGFAGPVLNPQVDRTGSGPLLVLVDGTWADARDWQRRQGRIAALLEDAARGGRPVAIALLTDLPAGALAFQAANVWESRLTGLTPRPWEPDAQAVQRWIAAQSGARFETFWMSDGVDRDSRAALLQGLEAKGTVTVFESPRPVLALRPATFDAGLVRIPVIRAVAGAASDVTVAAMGLDPVGIERELARAEAVFAAGAVDTLVEMSLPAELRNRISRFQIAGVRSAGAVSLTDDALKRREVALIAGRDDREGLELLSPLHYLRQALEPTADLIDGTIGDILLANPDAIVLADVATLTQAETDGLADWVDQGGLLLRFAGTRMASRDPGQSLDDPLLPVRLRSGGRTVGGAMSWGEPKSLRPFDVDSPFFGLAVPDDVRVTAQVMAQPDPTLASRVIAALTDGTPLVTRERIGQGQVVLFHVTANAEWSTLPLSGLFVQMLERLAISTRPAEPLAKDLAGTVWQADKVLDAFGQVGDAGAQAGIAGERLADSRPAADMPPGLYAGDDRRIAVNVVGRTTVLGPAVWPARIVVEGLGVATETALKGTFLGIALMMLMVDILASLWLSGRLRGARGGIAALLALGLLMPVDAKAQTPDEFAIAATSEVVLAHVVTGNAEVDRIAQAGLRGLSDVIFSRTSIEPAHPIAVNLEDDELSFFPFLYWPVTLDQTTPSAAAYARLNRYLRTGGMILFDTRDADVAQFGGSGPNGRKLQELARPLDIPPLEPLPADHVLTRAFYLLQDFPGRYDSDDVWVEAAPADAQQVEGMPFRNLNDGVTPVVIGGNDWAAAWAVDTAGNRMFPVGRGYAGERQREIAFRFGVNLIMHVLTGNYKSDQVHVPALLDRLGQ
ncbi:DUF4159 domain-containing protein [Pseudogemmobacter sp. W21_MBD1_M6]|uniref:DUF4159 domain-containing protein n=1 Tax=Pseudogemmobacter sp. W21_MBD1_M6 TaxID=3240271 RepID=UPI003F9B5A73